jgi:alpha-L-fucosidase
LQAEDIAALQAFGRYRQTTFASDLAAGAKASASNVRGNYPEYRAAGLVDNRPNSVWATDDAVLVADAVLDFGRAVTFSVIAIKEDIRFGQRIDAFAVDCWNGGKWEQLAAATSIGPRRFLRLDKPATTPRLRLRVTQASASPVVSQLSLFAEPADALR